MATGRRGSAGLNGGGPSETGTDGKAKSKRVKPVGSLDGRSPAGGRSEAAPLDEERIRQRAYGMWIEEGQPEGRDVDHWLRARGELEREAA